MGQGTGPNDELWYREGSFGANNAQIPAGAATTTINPSATGASIIARVTVTAAGTAATNFYDAANGVVGAALPLFTVPANAVVGTVYDVRIPYTKGLVAVGVANSPQLSLGFV